MVAIYRKAENVALVVGAYIVIGIALGVVGWQHVTATNVVTDQLAVTLRIQESAVAGVLGFFQFERFLATIGVVIAAGVGGVVGIRTGDVDVSAVGCLIGHPIMLLSSGVVVSFLVETVPGLGQPTPLVFLRPFGMELVAGTGMAALVGGAVAVSVVVLQP